MIVKASPRLHSCQVTPDPVLAATCPREIEKIATRTKIPTNGTIIQRSTVVMVACPKSGSRVWIATAPMMMATLSGVPGCRPDWPASTRAAPTMRMRPSTSKPIMVIQLKTASPFDPRGPNAARFTPNVVVPVVGPCSEHRPTRNHERLPTTISTSACASENPKVISSAP